MNLIKTLIADHQRLLVVAKGLEGTLPELTDSLNPTALDKLRRQLQQLIELLSSHGERERNGLFPVLRNRLPRADYWQIGMTESQDEMLLNEIRHLHELVSNPPLSVSVDQLRKNVTHFIRWLREHVRIEEEDLFPKLQGRSEGLMSASPGPTSLRKVSLWSRLKALFKRSQGT